MKETISKVKKQPSEREEIIANETTVKEWISKIYKQLMRLNTRKTNNPIKSGQETWTDISPKIQMATKHMKRCSTSLIIRKLQIKTTMRYHLTQVRMAIIKKSTNNKCWRWCGEKGTFFHRWWECKVVQPLWRGEQSGDSLKNWEWNCHTTQQSHCWAYHPEETRSETDTCTPMFTAALFTIARTGREPRCPTADEWIRKLWYIHTMEHYSAIKRNTFESVLMRCMNLAPVIQTEVSQKEKDKYLY